LALSLLGFVLLGTAPSLSAMPSPSGVETTPLTIDDASSALTQLAQAQPAPATAAPAPTTDASASTAAGDEPIGNVAALTGIATVIRNKDSIALKLKDDIYLNDTVATSASSSLGVTFNDATTFHLSANSKLTIDNYVYEDGGKQNAGIFDIGKGTVAFVAAAVAKTGDMKITTPTASLGIRGTTGVVEVPEGATAGSANNVNIKLYPDPDGRVGRIEVNDRTGSRLAHARRERICHPPKRRRALRRGAPCDLAARGGARPGIRAPGPRHPKRRPPDRHRAARVPPRQSRPEQPRQPAGPTAAESAAAESIAGTEPAGSAATGCAQSARESSRAAEAGLAEARTARSGAAGAAGPDSATGRPRHHTAATGPEAEHRARRATPAAAG
jgi:hypothetical protein